MENKMYNPDNNPAFNPNYPPGSYSVPQGYVQPAAQAYPTPGAGNY